MSQQRPSPRLPVVSLVIAVLAVVGMIVWSLVQWSGMEPTIVTREAAGNHGTSTVPRLVTAGAMPATLTVLTIVLAFAPRIDGRFLKLLGDPGTAGPRNRKASPRVLGILLVGFSILLVTLHVALVSLHTPQHLPIAPLISTAAGVLLILLGLTLPMIAPQAVTGTEIEERLRETQRRAYRRTAPLLMLAIGLGTIAAAWLAPTLAMPIAIGGVALLFLGIAATAIIRSRTR